MENEITIEQFNELAKNRNSYKILKPLDGELSYAKIGDAYYSDTLYERGYNILALVESGHLVCVNEPYEWQKDLVGKNVRTVYSYCPNCQKFGVNMPLDNTCGDCGHPKCITYYDAMTINNLMTDKNHSHERTTNIVSSE